MRNNSLKDAGHQCHARIRVSSDLKYYQVVKNLDIDGHCYHRHTCSRKEKSFNTVVGRLDE